MPIQPYQIAPAPIQQQAQVGTPTVPSGNGMFYTQTINGIVEAFFVNGAGQATQITSNGEVIGINYFEKSLKNNSGSTIAAGVPVSISSVDGSILAGDADGVNAQQIVGITLASIATGQVGKVTLFGRMIPGVLTGLGFAPGEEVYLGESAGSFVHGSAVNPNTDSVIRLGVACVADGLTGSAATDMILIREVISNS